MVNNLLKIALFRLERKFPDLKKPGFRQFCWRVFLFSAVTAAVLLLHPYLEKYYGYQIKGGDPYARYLAIGMSALTIFLSEHKLKNLPEYSLNKAESLIFIALAAVFFALPANPSFAELGMDKVILQYLWFFLGIAGVFFGVFGRRILLHLGNEILLLTLLLIPTLLLTFVVDKYWKYPSIAVFYSLTAVFSWLGLPVSSHAETFNITVKNFSAAIGPACAGFYSLFTFAALFVLSISGAYARGLILWKKALAYLFVALILLFLWNIVRVGVILLVGAYWSPKIALKVFHESLSALFLVGLFVYYLSYIVPKITRSK